MEPEQFGPYRLDQLIGRGGMGEVFRAFDTVRKRTVALKRLPPHLAADESFQARFRRESEVAARLFEPHIIPIHDYGDIEGQLYIDMPLVDGVDLEALLAQAGALAPARAVDIVSQVASALDAAHARGLVHRDVKPSNILIAGGPRGDEDFVYLVDFGVARTSGVSGTALTATGTTVGTWDYMAPERFTGRADDLRVDVYALACVLYEALTGRKPFDAEGLPALMYAHMHMAPVPASHQQPSVSAALDEVVAHGMAKDPDDRFPSAARLAAAARAAVASDPARAPAPPTTVGPAALAPVAAPLPDPRAGSPPSLPTPVATTGLTPASGEEPRPSLADSRRFSRVIGALSLIVGPLLLTTGNLVLLDSPDPDQDPGGFLDYVAANATRYQAAALTTFVGLLLLVVGLVGVIHLLRGPRITVGQVGAAVLVASALVGNAYAFQIVLTAAAQSPIDQDQVLDMLGAALNSPWLSGVRTAALVSVLGLILLAVGLGLNRATSRWVPVVLAASALLRTVVSEGGAAVGSLAFAMLHQFLAVLETALFAIAAVGIAVRILRLPDEQWARWTPMANAPAPGDQAAATGAAPAAPGPGRASEGG